MLNLGFPLSRAWHAFEVAQRSVLCEGHPSSSRTPCHSLFPNLVPTHGLPKPSLLLQHPLGLACTLPPLESLVLTFWPKSTSPFKTHLGRVPVGTALPNRPALSLADSTSVCTGLPASWVSRLPSAVGW